MCETGKYVYGIMGSNAARRLSIPDDFRPGESESDGVVYVIPHQDISALVRNSEIADYTRLGKDALARLLIGHQTVIERIMTRQAAIIPVRLGTFVQNETEVKEVLNKGYGLIRQILEKISGKIEIDVAATWNDFDSILKEVGDKKEIREFKEKLLANPEGVTIDDRMKAGLMAKKALDQMREECAQQIQNALKIICRDYRAHELMDDKMVINTAFLMDRTRQEDFDKKVEELNVGFHEKLNFRCVGPLPPYSFCTLEIKKLKFEEIDWARRKLGLQSNVVTRDQIKKAHQSMAYSFHPDRNPGIPGIERDFNEATTAYKLLCEYCQQDRCSFDEDEFRKNAILVKVRE